MQAECLTRLLLRAALPFAGVAILWIDLIRQLSYTWSTREQYSYGWFVPGFAIFLFWQRWLDRPISVGSKMRAWESAAMIATAAMLLPLRIVLEVNPDWPLVGWIYSGAVAGLTLFAIRLAGGWRWVSHFAFPVLFIFSAVAWPDRIEKGLTQSFMRVVAGLTVEALGLLGLPALQRGNLIEVGAGVVGVDEACSGIRSFQSTLMAGLLMGELNRLRVVPRLALVAIGVVMAFALNVVRAFLLSWQASIHGVGIIEKWHDPAGLTILAACFLFLWATALAFRNRGESGGSNPSEPRGGQFALPPWCRSVLLGIGIWSVCVLGATEVWYRVGQARATRGIEWTATFPTNSPGYKEIELSPRVIRLMGHDEGGAASWSEDDGAEWNGYFFRWRPRSIRSVMQSRAHRPDVCLPAAGLRQVGSSRFVSINTGWVTIPFRRYVYETSGQFLYVFFCLWEDSGEGQPGMQSSRQADRLQSAWSGRRRVGQQTLELILAGYGSAADAEKALSARMARLIQRDGSLDYRP